MPPTLLSCYSRTSGSTPVRRPTILTSPADAFVEAFVGTDRALKRLALISAATAAEPHPDSRALGSIPAEANLRDALAQMLTSGTDTLAVVAADGNLRGVLTLVAIRAQIQVHAPDDGNR